MLGINTLLNTTPFNQSPSIVDFGIISFVDGTIAESFTHETQLVIELSSDARSGDRFDLITFTTDPYYYHSDANNNFSFFCDYVAPVGNVNLVFPDTPCAAFASFEGYSGELAFVSELLTADLYQFWEGATADADLTTYRLLGAADAYAGGDWSRVSHNLDLYSFLSRMRANTA